MNITEENLNKLKDLFPEVFEEDKINFDKLQVVLGENIDKSNEKYEFSWNGKFEAMKLAQLQSTGTLIPCKEKSKDWDTTQNLYIEGDNLEVLKLLQKSYVNQIKMIYIDPPYNTGNDFVYKDNFSDNIANYKEITGQATKSNAETAGRYHTNWLNMMYPRLKLARNLLRDDGVIFISIDDNEQPNLRKICDEIFGENNFIADLVWKKKAGGANDSADIAVEHEYIICYRKKVNGINKIPLSEERIKEYKFSDEKELTHGKYALKNLNDKSLQDSKGLHFDIVCPDGSILYGKDNQWKCNEETFKQRLNDNRIVFNKKTDGTWTCNYKIYLNEEKGQLRYDENGNIIKKGRNLSSIIDNVLNRDGNDEIKQLFGCYPFSYPKPSKLIKQLIQCSTDKNSIILDFFSGSGTTAQAVMNMNLEDGGNRHFICVQLPELLNEDNEAYNLGYKNICDIGESRIKKVAESISNAQFDVGFKVFKLDTSNLVKWNNTPTEDVEELKKRLQQNLFYIVDGRNNMDLVYEIMLKYGLPLTLPITEKKYSDYKAYEIASDTYKVMICLDRNLPIEIIEQMTDEAVGTYVFADHCFGDANILINTEEILKKKSKNLRIF
ncbi:MAG: DNA methyltransferase [Eubacteriales bacterium]|nr:DNA methyltransferase [Eubacteriales bacterium]